MTNPCGFRSFAIKKESRASRGELGRHPVANSGQGSRERTADVIANSSGTFPLESRFKVTCLYQKDKVTNHPSYSSTPRCAYHPSNSLIRTKVDILKRTLTGFRPESNSPLLTEFVQSGVGTRAFYVGKVVWPRRDNTEVDQTPSLHLQIRRPNLLSLVIRPSLAA